MYNMFTLVSELQNIVETEYKLQNMLVRFL